MFQKVFSVKVFRRTHVAAVATLLVAATAVAAPLLEKPANAARAKATKFLVRQALCPSRGEHLRHLHRATPR